MATETKWQRIARQRAEYEAYLATTTDDPAMSQADFQSSSHTAKVAAMSAMEAQMTKAAPVSTAPKPRRVDRVWAGGDRDSDDISYR